MPGVIDRPNCANTANKSPPPPDRLDCGRWPASPPTGPGLPPSRALGPARSRASPGGSAGHRPPSRCGNQAGRGVQAMVSPRRHTARGSAAQSGGDPEEYAVDGSGYQNHVIRGKSTPREGDSPSRFKRARPTRCRRTDARRRRYSGGWLNECNRSATPSLTCVLTTESKCEAKMKVNA